MNFLAAARATTKPTPLPHQQAAWSYAWEMLSDEEQAAFLDKFRSDPPVKAITEPTYGNTWAGVTAAAKLAGAKYPELVAAQWALESGYGKHVSGTHNYFGLKGSGTATKTQEFINGQMVSIVDSFINFPDLLSCVRYLVNRWHCNYEAYKGCNNAASRNDAAKWLVKEGYATDPDYADKLIKLMSEQGAPAKATSVLLKVPYEYQLDNASGTGYRECFSSSCAMIAKFYGKVANDNEYNKIRSKFGDTTDSQSQLAALRSLGLQARFVTNAAPGLLELELRACRPVAVGWLHQGPYNAPTGGGHWSVLVGFDPAYWICNDPNGEADLINGGYENHTKGAGVKYSKERFERRWCADGAATGWCLLVKP